KPDKNESYIYRGSDNSYYEKFADGTEKCIDEALPFEIPDNWTWCRLINIGSWSAGATPPRGELQLYKGSIPWLKTGDLKDSYIVSIPESISDEAFNKCSVRLNPIGSVLMAMYGATIGKLGILSIPATTNQACCACIVCDSLDNQYLFYYLMSQRDNFIRLGAGGAQPNISKEKITNYLFPLPPLNEQRSIVQTLKSIINRM
ncbi:MAG: restriction endonuclease subunit S, partial [Lachnospiraceae bacterium]|nr:restriction endonuclease subunit S [Lachnospiraceae bacterium]